MASVLTILLPVFGLIALGYGMACTRLFTREGVRGFGNFVYYLALPALLFRGAAIDQAGAGGDPRVLAAYFLGAVALFALGMLIGRWRFGLDLKAQGVLAINVSFGNTVQLGLPLMLAAFGPAALAPMTLIIALHSMVLLTLATLVIELGRGGSGELGRSLHATARALLTNPIIGAIVLGFCWRSTGWPLPRAIVDFVELLAAAASPSALFALGAALAQFRLGSGAGETVVIVALKLLLQPTVVWLLGRALGLAPLDLAVATVAAALPIGLNAFIVAQRYGVYVDRSAGAVVLSNIVSVATLAAVLAAFAG
ncbi:MAG TPA: AEC family transporter [Stellaceae bacterium]|nr:AEC family transporter [Stellaceae bacterium]